MDAVIKSNAGLPLSRSKKFDKILLYIQGKIFKPETGFAGIYYLKRVNQTIKIWGNYASVPYKSGAVSVVVITSLTSGCC